VAAGQAARTAAAQEPLRLLTERAAQAKAKATPCQCPECHQKLTDQKYLARGIDSRFGRLRLWRGYGWCPHCETWCFPADHALGLAKKAAATPAQKQRAQEPLSSGAIESSCRQYQCRFKRTGQFWTTAGDEALLCLETFWRNDRWHELYPHAKPNLTLN